MSPTRVYVLGLATIIIVVSLVIFVALEVAGTISVDLAVITALTGLGSACGVGWIFCRASDTNTSRVLGRIDLVEGHLDGICRALSALPDVIDEQVGARIVEEQLAELRNLAPHVNGHEITRLRTVGE